MKQNVEDPRTYLPNHILRLCCWVSYEALTDPRAQLEEAAHEGESEEIRRGSRVVLAKMDWAQMHLNPDDYDIRTFMTPISQLAGFDPDWYEDLQDHGCSPGDLLYQVCIAFDSELDLIYFRTGTSEIY